MLFGKVGHDVPEVEMHLESQTNIRRPETAIDAEPWEDLERGGARVRC